MPYLFQLKGSEFMRALRLLMVMCAVSVLAAGSALAQATPPAQPPAKPPATPPATAPATAPATPPAAAPAPKPEAPRPYPEGAKVAYIDIQAVACELGRGQGRERAELQELREEEGGGDHREEQGARDGQDQAGDRARRS